MRIGKLHGKVCRIGNVPYEKANQGRLWHRQLEVYLNYRRVECILLTLLIVPYQSIYPPKKYQFIIDTFFLYE